MAWNEGNKVMQFKDGRFLEKGTSMGYVWRDGGFVVGRTSKLKDARRFKDEAEANEALVDLEMDESYKLREVVVTIELKPE